MNPWNAADKPIRKPIARMTWGKKEEFFLYASECGEDAASKQNLSTTAQQGSALEDFRNVTTCTSS